LFAEHGFDQATVRAIADRAQADPALVIRYFGNKEKLFASATEIDLQLPDLVAVAAPDVGPVLIEHFLDLWEDDATGRALTILLRTSASDPNIAVRVREIFQRQVMPALEGLVAPEELAKRSGLISSQLLGLALSRYVLRLPPVVAMEKDDLILAVGPSLQRYVVGNLDERG